MSLHKDVTDPDLHEPKGVSGASSNTVYAANGAGSGTWTKVTAGIVDTTSIKNVNKFWVTASLQDVSTASSVLIPVTFTGSLTALTGVLGGPISVADSILTIKKNGSSTIGSDTVAYTASAKGDTYLISISANSLVAGDYIEILTNGASGTTTRMDFILEFTL